MAKKRILKDRPKQGFLFKGIEEPGDVVAGPRLVPWDFKGHPVRSTDDKDNPIFILEDVCARLDLRAADVSQRLKDDEKVKVDLREFGGYYPPGGQDPLGSERNPYRLGVTEKGLYRVIFQSRAPNAEEFQDWVFGEVLPAIRKTGGYKLPVHKRVVREQRRLRCDTETAMLRCEQFNMNREDNERLYKSGVNVAMWHNAGYEGAFNKTAQQLRDDLNLSGKRTPLDRFSRELLAENLHSKAISTRIIREKSVPPEQQPLVLKGISRQQMREDLARLPAHTVVGVIDGGKRGLILDFICPPKEIA